MIGMVVECGGVASNLTSDLTSTTAATLSSLPRRNPLSCPASQSRGPRSHVPRLGRREHAAYHATPRQRYARFPERYSCDPRLGADAGGRVRVVRRDRPPTTAPYILLPTYHLHNFYNFWGSAIATPATRSWPSSLAVTIPLDGDAGLRYKCTMSTDRSYPRDALGNELCKGDLVRVTLQTPALNFRLMQVEPAGTIAMPGAPGARWRGCSSWSTRTRRRRGTRRIG